MTRAELLTEVLAAIEPHGYPYHESEEEQNGVLNRRLRLYTELTRCLYDDAVPFTVPTSTALVDLHGSAFTKDFARIESIWIDGAELLNYQGERGPCSLDELRRYDPAYLSATAAKPSRWAMIPANSIRLFPISDQAYSNSYGQGHVLHSEIDVTTAGDGTAIEIPEPYILGSAVIFCAVGLIRSSATVASDLEMMEKWSKSAGEEMRALMFKARKMLDGPCIRGHHLSGGDLHLGSAGGRVWP